MKKKRHSHNPKLRTTHSIKGVIIGVGAITIISLGVLITKYFSVKQISCHLSDGSSCPAELTDKLKVLKGKSMFFTDYHTVLIKNANISQPYSLQQYSKRLPDILNVMFAKEQPLVLLNQMNTWHVISDTGKAFPQTEESLVPQNMLIIETEQNLISENTISPDVQEVIKEIIVSIESKALPIEKITWVDKSTIRLSMKDRTEVAVIDSESPALELQRLSVILQSKEYQDLAESKRELDLRFVMPVLRTEP